RIPQTGLSGWEQDRESSRFAAAEAGIGDLECLADALIGAPGQRAFATAAEDLPVFVQNRRPRHAPFRLPDDVECRTCKATREWDVESFAGSAHVTGTESYDFAGGNTSAPIGQRAFPKFHDRVGLFRGKVPRLERPSTERGELAEGSERRSHKQGTARAPERG